MKTLTATPIEHKDIRNNVLYYVKITNETDEYIINVGKKTYDNLKKLSENPAKFDPKQNKQNELKNELTKNQKVA